ncbi:MAG: hypothetical protein Ta2A_16980 [Treponemataceae bacterium]|nr:MAG: hypothetical protein Ta2A_16980 [Treponemataceae bacterium]
MIIHKLRKAIALALLYAILIFGIFALQFNGEIANESESSSTLGSALRISVISSVESGNSPIRKRLKLMYMGLTILDALPANLVYPNNKLQPIVLLSWRQIDDENAEFIFSNDVTLSVMVPKSENQGIIFAAELPEDAEYLSLPYSLNPGYAISERTSAYVLISSRNRTFTLNSPDYGNQEIILYRMNPTASYVEHNKEDQKFSFNAIANYPLSSDENFEKTTSEIAAQLILLYTQSVPKITDEAVVTSYVAAMADAGNYAQALSSADVFKQSSARTYVSSPFFGSLQAMSKNLMQTHDAQLAWIMETASIQDKLALFSDPSLSEYILREINSQKIIEFLSLPGTIPDFSPNLMQAAGILDTYSILLSDYKAYTAYLEPVLATCIDAIEASCTIIGDSISLNYLGRAAAVVEAATVGSALIRYGKITAQSIYKSLGCLIINSMCKDKITTFDAKTLAQLYPLVASENTFYPHTVYLRIDDRTSIWAWTSATSITFRKESLSDLSLNIEFPQGAAHYLIIGGMAPFREIEIYGIPFRTDPRFEVYNSSGYVYDSQSRLLLLKSLNKTRIETVKLRF